MRDIVGHVVGRGKLQMTKLLEVLSSGIKIGWVPSKS